MIPELCWARADELRVVTRVALWEMCPYSLTSHPSLHDISGLLFSQGVMISYQVCRAGRWPWWCVHTPLRVCGNPILHPEGHIEAPSVLLPPAVHSCPTRQGTWLQRNGATGKSILMVTLKFWNNEAVKKRKCVCMCTRLWMNNRHSPSSGMGSISQGLIFSVSPLSQLDRKHHGDVRHQHHHYLVLKPVVVRLFFCCIFVVVDILQMGHCEQRCSSLNNVSLWNTQYGENKISQTVWLSMLQIGRSLAIKS